MYYCLESLRHGKMTNEIIVKGICMNFGTSAILNNISFTIKESEFVSIVGPSGCGKTTLLYLIQGLIKPTRGEVLCSGRTGFVFQDHNLFPWKTVKENILIATEDESAVNQLLGRLDLTEFSNYYPSQVSEGMKQRVGIGRCLAYQSEIILMDEPFCSLDYFTKTKVQEFLIRLWKERRLTILFVTHDIEEAIKLSDKIVVLSKLPATVLKIIAVDRRKKCLLKKEILDLIEKSISP